MNKTLIATVLACAGAFGVAANADARDWGNERHDGYDYRYRNRDYFERHMDLPYNTAPALHNYVPQPLIETGCSNTYSGSQHQFYDPNSQETIYRPSLGRCP